MDQFRISGVGELMDQEGTLLYDGIRVEWWLGERFIYRIPPPWQTWWAQGRRSRYIMSRLYLVRKDMKV
ncbi:hypothetical protein EYC80_003328 [Monilinia laxa]|uniref:Uncharacterized protein n=1 Tax=Monilinia laxa TaxID=61186 RepID=A0A5N6KDK2_MONLA|nr:hypothetical protein EYC80_003328 [Monilinia laxa]